MRKIRFLLVALFALIGVRAFAALPEADQKGFLYNLGSGQFITADATLGETGVEFTIEIKEKDANATPSVEGAKFMRFKTGSNYLTFYTEPVAMSTYYGQLIVKSTEKGLLITHPYPNDQGPSWITAGSYLQVVDGALACTALDEANKGAYWFFGTEEELAEYLKQQQGGDQAIMNAAVKAAYDAALASYNANPNEETEAALVKAKRAATASIIAYKGVRSSIEMHKQLLSGDDVEDFMDAVADIIEDLNAGTLEGSGIAEMAEIAGIYAELTADEGASEIAIFPYSTECTVGENYVPGDNHGITIDWDEIAAELGVEKDALKIYAMMPDGTLDETYGRGSAGTDGWRDAEGNWASWNSADNLFYVQLTGLNLDGVGCMRTAEPTSYTALFKIVNAADTEGNYVVLSITLNVNEKVISPFTEFSQLQVAETMTQAVNVGEKPSYVAAVDVDADMASILAALGVSSINEVQIFAVQSDGTLDEAYKLGSTDGWRNAAGDWAQWGDATSQFYVKSDFSREAGQLYEIGCHPEHSGAHLQGGVQYIAKFAFVVGNSEENKAVILNVAVQSEGEPVAPVAPTPKATQLATDGETIQYLYNVDAKAFIVGANDWGTRVSINQKEGHQFKVQVNADGTTYTLNDWVARDNIWSSMDCQGPDNIWVDGKGRAGDGMFTIAFNEDGSFKIASNNVAGFLSVLPSKNDTKVYMSEDLEAQSTWIAVSAEDYADFQTAIAAMAEEYAAYDKLLAYYNEGLAIKEVKALLESTNVVTPDAYEAYKAIYEDALAKHANKETVVVDNPSTVHGWHATNVYDDFLLSAWTYNGTQASEFSTSLYINTWSVEADGKEGASPMHVPFYEYWTGDDNSLGVATLEGTVTDLEPGNYTVQAVVRVRVKNNNTEDAHGITLSANGSNPIEVANGRACADGDQFRWNVYFVNAVVGSDGILKIDFNVEADNNISWLSFKDVKYSKQQGMTPIIITQEATAISEVEATSAAKTIFNAAGQRINTLQKGLNIVNGKKVLVK